jgi:hypothetical protein
MSFGLGGGGGAVFMIGKETSNESGNWRNAREQEEIKKREKVGKVKE